MRSRMTLATIDAAAIDWERWSPLTTARPRQGRAGGTSRPSASTILGGVHGFATDLRIASRRALRISPQSIECAHTEEKETETARARISSNTASRAALSIRFESSNPSGMLSGSRITAAATTGPASGPRPASSVPATGHSPSRRAEFSREKSGLTGRSKRVGESEADRDIVRQCLASAPILRKSFRFPGVGAEGYPLERGRRGGHQRNSGRYGDQKRRIKTA